MVLIPPSFNKPIDPSDVQLHAQLRRKTFPFSYAPFDKTQEDPTFDETQLSELPEEEPELSRVEAVPEWLELFFDLAWTATFSGLTAGTPIKGPMTVLGFCVFFVLAWWLWIAQVLYDTRFFVNDWWHRIMLLLQFLMFGTLCAFTTGFDVAVGFKRVTEAADIVDSAYVSRAFGAISIILCASRVLLAIEHIRVILYAKHRKLTHIYAYTGCLLLSAVLFLGASIATLTTDRHAKDHEYKDTSRALAKFLLWGFAIGIEVIAYLTTSMPRGTLCQGSMPKRLSTLTTVIIGEGLNGFIDPITSTVRSIGFNGTVGIQIIVTLLVVFLIFLIYFQSFNSRNAPTALRQKLVILGHFPVQLCIILLLEGMKSILNITTLANSFKVFVDKYGKSNHYLTEQGTEFYDFYNQLGLNLTDLQDKTFEASRASYKQYLPENVFIPEFDDEDSLLGFIEDETEGRLIAAAVQALLKTFKVLEDKQADAFTSYVNDAQNLGALYDTLDLYTDSYYDVDETQRFDHLVGESVDERYGPAQWIAIAAGTFLLSLAFVMICNGMPRNRYAWWSFMTRVVGGIAICLLAIIDTNQRVLDRWVDIDWFLPTIALCYAVIFAIDYVISFLATRAVKRLELRRHEEPGSLESIPDLYSSSITDMQQQGKTQPEKAV